MCSVHTLSSGSVDYDIVSELLFFHLWIAGLKNTSDKTGICESLTIP